MDLISTSTAGRGADQDQQLFKLRSALCHLELKGDLDGYAGSRSEKLALLRHLGSQKLIKWNRTRARHELTREGRKSLRLLSDPEVGNGRPAPWMIRPLRSVSAKAVLAVAAALICGGSMIWVAGMSSSSLASNKDRLAIENIGPMIAAAPQPEIVRPSPVKSDTPAPIPAPAVSVAAMPSGPAVSAAAMPPIMAADENPAPRPALPAKKAPAAVQKQAGIHTSEPAPAPAANKTDDGAAAAAPAQPEKRKRVTHKRHKTPKNRNNGFGNPFNFGGGFGRMFRAI